MEMPAAQKKHIKKLIVILTTIVLISVAYGAYAYSSNAWPFTKKSSPVTQNNSPTNQEKEQQEKQDAQDKQTFLDNENKQTPSTPQESGKNESKLPPISMEAKKANNQLVITTNLSSISSGTCTLTLTKGDQAITKVAEVIYAPEYSTCAGFSIATTELGRGTWDISLSVKTTKGTAVKAMNYTL